ncbi:hypothetical protein HY745_03505 [Candidatus Desantisbacteria bacterium]|nr:hypothetical protein [Candidatus Desantisbacteria bacterium]
MNLENILSLIQDHEVKSLVMKILEYEQSQLHKLQPQYKEIYRDIIDEAFNEN